MNLQDAEFIKSVVSPEGFIRDRQPQIVFAGKSNVGKSSVINRLLNRRNFARVGMEPGKTVHINYFHIDGRVYFVDLPGYGYAKVSKSERDRWGRLMELYFSENDLISLGILIVDARHKPTGDDITMAKWFFAVNCPVIIVANKADKVKQIELDKNMDIIRNTLELPEDCLLLPFSAETGTNKDKLLAEIEKAGII